MKHARCQSCAQPIGIYFKDQLQYQNYGTNTDGSFHHEYCELCFKDGKFAHPHLTVSEMIEYVASYMVEHMKMDLNSAEKMAEEMIPQLKRWKAVS